MALVKYSNGHSPVLSDWLEDFFGKDMFDLPRFQPQVGGLGQAVPAVNIRETAEEYQVEVAAPGLKKEDFNITLENNLLTISAEKKAENEEKKEGKFTRREFSYQAFRRSFAVPNTVETDKIKASYTDGVLNILIPKRDEAKQKPARQIEIG